MTVLIDTDVLIDHLRGVPDAQDFLLRLESDVSCPAISVISVAEIEAGLRDSERPLVEYLFAAMQVYDVDKSIARQASLCSSVCSQWFVFFTVALLERRRRLLTENLRAAFSHHSDFDQILSMAALSMMTMGSGRRMCYTHTDNNLIITESS